MDARPPPEVTIVGGPVRSSAGRRDVLGSDDEPANVGSRWVHRHRLGGLALAAVAGFVLATVLADLRTSTIEESAEGVLSLELGRDDENIRPHIAAGPDGGHSLATRVVLRNTGPRPVALDRVELLGTPYRSDDLRRRRLAEGAESVVVLLRSIDCARLEPTSAPGPLRVHATTAAGSSSVDLRMDAEALTYHDEQVRGACGQNHLDSSLFVLDARDTFDGATLVVDLLLSNASARSMSVERLVPGPGLRIAGVESRDGRPISLPLPIEPGDFDPPVDPFLGRGPETELVVRLEVEDCALFRPPFTELSPPGVQLWLADGRHGHHFGVETVLHQRMHDLACSGQSS